MTITLNDEQARLLSEVVKAGVARSPEDAVDQAVRRADVMYVYHPPATIALPALVIRTLRGIPFVYDIQDLWPDTLAATGMVRSRVLLRLAGWWCRLTYEMADQIVVLSPGFKRVLIRRGVSEAR